jgi:hypothetical protein
MICHWKKLKKLDHKTHKILCYALRYDREVDVDAFLEIKIGSVGFEVLTPVGYEVLNLLGYNAM